MRVLRIAYFITTTLILLSYSLLGQDTTFSQLATIHVLVTDFENNSKKGEQLLFEGLNSGSVYKGISDENGKIDIQLRCGETYFIKIKSIGEAQDYNQLSIPALNNGESLSPMLLTIKFEPPRNFTLDNVHFDSGKNQL